MRASLQKESEYHLAGIKRCPSGFHGWRSMLMYLLASVDSSSVAPLFAPPQTTTLLLRYSFTRNRIEDIC